MGFKETMKDIGRTVTGEGQEVKFKKDVERYSKDHGCTIEEAQIVMFTDSMNQVQSELMLTGVIDSKSKSYRRFQAAMHEIFNQTEINKFKTDSNTSLYIPISTPTIGEQRNSYNRSKAYYSGKYKGEMPNHMVLDDAGKKNLLVNKLMDRYVSGASFSGPDNLNTIMAAHPEVGADLGMILRARQQIKNHENKFFTDKKFNESMKQLGNDTLKLLESAVGGSIVTFLKIVQELVTHHNFRGVTRSMKMLTKHFGRVAVDSINFGSSAIKSAGYGFRKATL